MTSATKLYKIVTSARQLDQTDLATYDTIAEMVAPMLAQTRSAPPRKEVFDEYRDTITDKLAATGTEIEHAKNIASAIMLGGAMSTSIIATINVPMCMLFWGMIEVDTKMLYGARKIPSPKTPGECPKHFTRVSVINTSSLHQQLTSVKSSSWTTILRFGPWGTHNEAVVACREINETLIMTKTDRIKAVVGKIDALGCTIYCNKSVYTKFLETICKYDHPLTG